MVQAPVGIRCREHGKAAPMPTFDVGPTYYARAIGVGVAVGVAVGVGVGDAETVKLWVTADPRNPVTGLDGPRTRGSR